MQAPHVLTKMFVPAASVVGAAVSFVENDLNRDRTVMKPSELPIYVAEPEKPYIPPPTDEESNALEMAIRSTRQTLTKYTDEVKAYERVGLDYIEQSKHNLDWMVNYLRQEDNTMPKTGAIAIGGLTGFILGLRGGFFKRTIYATTGALAMASVCYPKEAAEYSQVGLHEAKKYMTIGYNFIYGVQKDDPPLELPSLPKLPSSLSEAWESVKSTANSLVSDSQDAKPKEAK